MKRVYSPKKLLNCSVKPIDCRNCNAEIFIISRHGLLPPRWVQIAIVSPLSFDVYTNLYPLPVHSHELTGRGTEVRWFYTVGYKFSGTI